MSDVNNNAQITDQSQTYSSTASSKPSMPDNNLIWAVLCTVMCCVPLGVVAIIKSTEVEKYWKQGEYDKAQKAADDAKKWSLIGAGATAVFVVLYLIFIICCAMLELAVFDLL